MNKEYRVIGEERIGRIARRVDTTYVAKNRDQAILLANRDNISIREITLLGETEESVESKL